MIRRLWPRRPKPARAPWEPPFPPARIVDEADTHRRLLEQRPIRARHERYVRDIAFRAAARVAHGDPAGRLHMVECAALAWVGVNPADIRRACTEPGAR